MNDLKPEVKMRDKNKETFVTLILHRLTLFFCCDSDVVIDN